MLAGKILKMPGNFKEIYTGRGLTEDGGSVSLKKNQHMGTFQRSMLIQRNIFTIQGRGEEPTFFFFSY